MPDKRKVLVIEDEPDFRLGVRIWLEANNFDVLEADDGAVGLEMARSQAPDIIVLDVMLPKMDGYQVARFLKFDRRYNKIPIIMLTARSQVSDKKTGTMVGADAYLTKPFEPEKLHRTIIKLLEG